MIISDSNPLNASTVETLISSSVWQGQPTNFHFAIPSGKRLLNSAKSSTKITIEATDKETKGVKKEELREFTNPGVVSRQLLNPENSSSERVTITEVHLEIGACQPRHTHDASEQIWYATKGTGKLLLADEQEKVFTAGDVVRFADKDVHGLLNDGNEEFVYVSVTAPPINFGYAYKDKR